MRFYASIIMAFLGLLALAKGTSASEQSLSINPPIVRVDTIPPSSPVVPLIVSNNTKDETKLEIKLIPIKASGFSGKVIFAPENENKSFYPLYKQKIQFLSDSKKTDTLVLQGLESKLIHANINVEKGDPPGDFYYAILFISKSNSSKDSSQSTIPTGITSILLLSVGPKNKPAGSISQFKTSSYKNNGPVDFQLKIHNSGNHLIQPAGNIEIKNILSANVRSVPIQPQYILSHTDRYLSGNPEADASDTGSLQVTDIPYIRWSESFIFGLYKATANVKISDEGPVLKSTVYFVAFPLYFFLPLVASLFILVSIYLRVRKIV